MCDALGNPVAFHLTPGHLHDLHGADALLPKVVGRFKALLADRTYDRHLQELKHEKHPNDEDE